MEIIKLYTEALKNKADAGFRIVRKSAVIYLFLSILIIIYRHGYLNISMNEGLMATLIYMLLFFLIFGVIGGFIAATLYETYLEKLGGDKKALGIVIFIVELIIATIVPLVAPIIIYLFIATANNALI